MKTTTCLTLFFFAGAGFGRADSPKAPIYEENFNTVTSRIEYVDGGGLGGPGTGVSGKTSDRAYMARLKTTENVSGGPAGMARAPIAPNPLTAFTCTFWYYLDEQGPDLQVPLSTAGVLFLMTEKGFEVRIENQTEQPRSYVFAPGIRGPLAGWRDPNRWIFAAFSWNQATNTLVVHQGTPTEAVTYMRDMTRPVPAKPSLPRTDLGRDPEVIANTFHSHERPLAGRMDNLRFYERVLDRAELESIRRADIANEPVK